MVQKGPKRVQKGSKRGPKGVHTRRTGLLCPFHFKFYLLHFRADKNRIDLSIFSLIGKLFGFSESASWAKKHLVPIGL